MLLFYVRHGRPTYVPDALTPIGHRQAESVAKRLALYGIDKVFASSSQRAIETATPTAEYCEKEITILDWCSESHAWHDTAAPNDDGSTFWAYAIPKYRKVLISSELLAMGDNWHSHPAFSGIRFKEGFERVNREVDAFMKSFGYIHDRTTHSYKIEKPNDERVALFAHEGFGKMFISSLLDIPYPIVATRLELGYTGVTAIDFEPEDDETDVVIPRILTLSNDSHLFRDGLPTKYKNCLYY